LLEARDAEEQRLLRLDVLERLGRLLEDGDGLVPRLRGLDDALERDGQLLLRRLGLQLRDGLVEGLLIEVLLLARLGRDRRAADRLDRLAERGRARVALLRILLERLEDD